MSTQKLAGKVAVITGGNSGIGLATAQEFVQQGARVIITGRDPETLQEAARQLGEAVFALRADTSRLEDIDALAAAVRERFNRIDVLFVNAGVGKFVPIDAVTEEIFDEMVNINLKGAYFTIQKLLPLMEHGGSIVLNASIAGLIGMPNTSVYSATKAAVRNLARTLSAELVERGIRVNIVSPGPVDTPILDRLGFSAVQLAEFKDEIRQKVPMKRVGAPQEIAKTVLFLASDDSSFVLGAELVADGGLSQL
ncbi:MAG TPA: SDR family oxidoreductase [Thermoanaerobaculia bacterium]|jgi:NAD(P)-dependent dehydrogenase (short-subunit alcohol dehydrogenase family)|nr:SDR family oxidoreductase [Thermoanaerobaculia bacterium]